MKIRIFITVFTVVCSLSAQEVSLRVEQLFPDSPYRRVYGTCTDLWSSLRSAAGPYDQFHEGFVDALVGLDRQVKQLASQSRHMPDDLEHLLGIVQVMHGEYVYATLQKSDDIGAVHAVSYFFKRIRQRLEKLLTASTN